MLKSALFSAIAGSLLALSVAADASDSSDVMVKVWEIDTSGRPPFKRTLVEIPAADLAQLEVIDTERVWHVDYSGRPPYRRGFDELPVVDAAALDVIGDAGSEARPSPIFKKRHR
ncbi:MAG: hypothetical protein PsegKO_28430 [Pseudohongiellaceae bacterium]